MDTIRLRVLRAMIHAWIPISTLDLLGLTGLESFNGGYIGIEKVEGLGFIRFWEHFFQTMMEVQTSQTSLCTP